MCIVEAVFDDEPESVDPPASNLEEIDIQRGR